MPDAGKGANMKRLFPVIAVLMLLVGCSIKNSSSMSGRLSDEAGSFPAAGDIPAYSGSMYTEINGNTPYFSQEDITDKAYEHYSELDGLGRCGAAMACIGRETMPTEERGPIGMIRPTGWHLDKYDFVDGKYLYNRCHLIGYQLTGENANERNLITGTRNMNIYGMLPFENQTASYIRRTGNHVVYRVTPVFSGDDLLCAGVLMEAYSVEDNGEGVCFNVFCYNVCPGVDIDYSDGSNQLSAGTRQETDTVTEETAAYPGTADDTTESGTRYVLNTRSRKIHLPDCKSVGDMAEHNRQDYCGSIEDLIAMGYSPCGSCRPDER